MKLTRLLLALLLAAFVSATRLAPAHSIVFGKSQETPAANDRQQGIRLYQENRNAEALKALESAIRKDKTDATAWYYLGLLRIRMFETGKARKAFETAVKLKPDFAPARTAYAYTLMLTNKTSAADYQAKEALKLDGNDPQAHFVVGVVDLREGRSDQAREEADYVIRQTPDVAPPYLLKCEALIAHEANRASRAGKIAAVPPGEPLTNEERDRRQQALRKRAETFQSAAEALDQYLRLAPQDRDTAVWREQVRTLRIYSTLSAEPAPGDYTGLFSGWQVTTRAIVREKPPANYPTSARSSAVEGTVILLGVFSASGRVENILVLRSLPLGLTSAAVEAAKKIKFTPAIKDGRPVSQLMQLEYTFNLI